MDGIIYYVQLVCLILSTLSLLFIFILYIKLCCMVKFGKKNEELEDSISSRLSEGTYYDEYNKTIKIGLGNHYMFILTLFNILNYLIEFIIIYKKDIIFQSFKFFFKLNSFCWIILISHLFYNLNKNPEIKVNHKKRIIFGFLYSLIVSSIFYFFFFYFDYFDEKKKIKLNQIYSNILFIIFFLFIIGNFIFSILTLICSLCYLKISSIHGNKSYIMFHIIFFIFFSLLFLLALNSFSEIIKIINYLLGFLCSFFCFFFFKSVISCLNKNNNDEYDNDNNYEYTSIDLAISC